MILRGRCLIHDIKGQGVFYMILLGQGSYT